MVTCVLALSSDPQSYCGVVGVFCAHINTTHMMICFAHYDTK